MKVKNTAINALRYFRELSVVVIGIFITFSINNYFEKKKEKHNLNFYLNTVKEELVSNLDIVNEHIYYYEQNLKFRNILLATPYKEIPTDSILKYKSSVYTDRNFRPSDYAWKMFEASGKMDLVQDKYLLLNILMCYKEIEDLRSVSEFRTKMKTELLLQIFKMEKGRYNPDYPEVKGLFDHIKDVVTTNNAEYYGYYVSRKKIEELLQML